MGMITMIKLNSDNFENTYMSEVAYKQVRLTMSSGDFGTHKAKKITFDEFDAENESLRQAYRSPEFIHMFDENGEPTHVKAEFDLVVEPLTFKQYSKMMKKRFSVCLSYAETLKAIKKVTKSKQILNKVDNLLWVLENTPKLKVVG
jgi:hypothetical protein